MASGNGGTAPDPNECAVLAAFILFTLALGFYRHVLPELRQRWFSPEPPAIAAPAPAATKIIERRPPVILRHRPEF